MYRRHIALCLLTMFLLFLVPIHASQVEVTGRIVGSDDQPLSGIHFSLYLYGDLILDDIVSDDQGNIRFEVEKVGVYQLRQTSKMDGYLPVYVIPDIEVDAKEESITFDDVVNERILRNITLHFMDEDGEPLSHVRADLINDDEEILRQIESDKEGKIVIEDISFGGYTIKQKSNLKDYTQKKDMKFYITNENYDLDYELNFVFTKAQHQANPENDPTLMMVFIVLLGVMIGGVAYGIYYIKKT